MLPTGWSTTPIVNPGTIVIGAETSAMLDGTLGAAAAVAPPTAAAMLGGGPLAGGGVAVPGAAAGAAATQRAGRAPQRSGGALGAARPPKTARTKRASKKPKARAATLPKVGTGLNDTIGIGKRFGLGVTSTTGGKHAPNSWHYKSRAADFGQGTHAQKMALMSSLKANPSGVLEAFYDPAGFYIKNGEVIKGAFGGHPTHVHLAR